MRNQKGSGQPRGLQREKPLPRTHFLRITVLIATPHQLSARKDVYVRFVKILAGDAASFIQKTLLKTFF